MDGTDPPAGAPPGDSEAPAASAAVAQSRTAAPRLRPPTSPSRSAPSGREDVHYTVGARVTRAARSGAYERRPGRPLSRSLRAYTLDANASRADGAVAAIAVPYEELRPGPVGAILEVVDDAAVDLDAHEVLLQQGYTPSPSDPRFRAQMAYAVCSTTYAAFRQALGRQVAWGFDRDEGGGPLRLRVRPVAESAANAYYDKVRGELRFGAYEAADAVHGRNVPRGRVFTCLSHDIVVHEMAHALLDGLRAHFTHPSNPDVLAFHEAFADLVAIFQRFTYADVVRAALARVCGDLSRPSVLSEIGRQLGQTTGMPGAVRDALGGTERRYADRDRGPVEPHEFGLVLVAAVFDAFATVVGRKTRRYVRLATGGSGVTPAGELPGQLLDVLGDEVRQIASQFLSVCIRAIDYCPPVDLTFGEFLRAVITADFDLVPDDRWDYREAWIDGFTKYGIYPSGVASLAEDALLWRPPTSALEPMADLAFARLQFRGDPGRAADEMELRRQARALGTLVGTPAYLAEFGCAAADDPRLDGDALDLPVIESVRTSRRVGPDGQVVFDLVAEVTQRRTVGPRDGRRGFDVYGGATVILDPEGRVRYTIGKSVLDAERVERQRVFVAANEGRFWGRAPDQRLVPEPQLFRLTHARAREGRGAG